MTDYAEVTGLKYKGKWVEDMSMGELLRIPLEDFRRLRLTDNQKDWIKLHALTPFGEEVEQYELAIEYERDK